MWNFNMKPLLGILLAGGALGVVRADKLVMENDARLTGTVRSSYRSQGRQRIEVVDTEGRVLAVEDFDGIRHPAGHPVGLRINGGHVFG